MSSHTRLRCRPFVFFFFFNDTATTEIYTLSLHDALPISPPNTAPSAARAPPADSARSCAFCSSQTRTSSSGAGRSEEHTSELQSPCNLVCRLLLEKKKKSFRGSKRARHYDAKRAHERDQH